MEFQLKAEYVKDKWLVLVSAAWYRAKDLVEDITSRCTTLNYLNETTIRLRYLDDDVAIGNVKVLTSKLRVETCMVSRSTGKRSRQ